MVAGRTYVERPAGFSTSTIEVFRPGPVRPPRRPPVALNPATVAVLRAHRQGLTESRLLAGAAWIDTGLVFTHEDGHAMQSEQPMKRALATASKVRLSLLRPAVLLVSGQGPTHHSPAEARELTVRARGRPPIHEPSTRTPHPCPPTPLLRPLQRPRPLGQLHHDPSPPPLLAAGPASCSPSAPSPTNPSPLLLALRYRDTGRVSAGRAAVPEGRRPGGGGARAHRSLRAHGPPVRVTTRLGRSCASQCE